jgi:hypothetical protein
VRERERVSLFTFRSQTYCVSTSPAHCLLWVR